MENNVNETATETQDVLDLKKTEAQEDSTMVEEKEVANTTPSEKVEDEKENSVKDVFQDIFDIIETVFTSIFVVILLFAFVVRPVTVDGRSMNSTLQDGDHLLMSDLLYTPEYGDIVIVDNTYATTYDAEGNLRTTSGLPGEKRLIKRIIATGGQTIQIDFTTGSVYVDGELLDEPYINNITNVDEGGFDFSEPVTVPEGYYFVMGDNRQNSTDSRSAYVGFISRDAILGKAIFRFSLNNFGSIYTNFEK